MTNPIILSLKRGAVVRAVIVGLVAFVAAKVALAGETEIRASIEKLYPGAKVTSVAGTETKGIYEVVVGQEVVYSDEGGKYLFMGPLIDTTRRLNLTELRKEKITAVDFKDLPLELAVKTVKGDGSRPFASFEDPNCGYCKKMHESLKAVDNYTMYTFLIPILSEDSKVKTAGILCSNDKSKALNDFMVSGMPPAPGSCDTPTQRVLALAQKLGVRGTPTLFFENGKRVAGYMPGQQFAETLMRNSRTELATAMPEVTTRPAASIRPSK